MSLEKMSDEDNSRSLSGLFLRGFSLGLGSTIISLYALPSIRRISGLADISLSDYEDPDGESDTSLGGMGMVAGGALGALADLAQAGVAGYLAFNGSPEWAIGMGVTNALSGAYETVRGRR
jgi:hypothetical protein